MPIRDVSLSWTNPSRPPSTSLMMTICGISLWESPHNNYWIMDEARKLPQRQNQVYNCRCGAVGQTSWKDLSLFQTWFTVKCLENEVVYL